MYRLMIEATIYQPRPWTTFIYLTAHYRSLHLSTEALDDDRLSTEPQYHIVLCTDYNERVDK